MIQFPLMIESLRRNEIRMHPERREQIEADCDNLLEEVHAYEAECERQRNSPKVRALRARQAEIQFRVYELQAEIHNTPARTAAGILRKVLASYPSGMAPPIMKSVAHDLYRFAEEA